MHPEQAQHTKPVFDLIKYRKQWFWLLILLLCAAWYKKNEIVVLVIASMGVLILFFSFKLPVVFETITQLLQNVGKWIGWVVQPVIAGIFYFIVFTPIALISKLVRKKNNTKLMNIDSTFFDYQF